MYFLFLGRKASKRNFFVIKSFFFIVVSIKLICLSAHSKEKRGKNIDKKTKSNPFIYA